MDKSFVKILINKTGIVIFNKDFPHNQANPKKALELLFKTKIVQFPQKFNNYPSQNKNSYQNKTFALKRQVYATLITYAAILGPESFPFQQKEPTLSQNFYLFQPIYHSKQDFKGYKSFQKNLGNCCLSFKGSHMRLLVELPQGRPKTKRVGRGQGTPSPKTLCCPKHKTKKLINRILVWQQDKHFQRFQLFFLGIGREKADQLTYVFLSYNLI